MILFISFYPFVIRFSASTMKNSGRTPGKSAASLCPPSCPLNLTGVPRSVPFHSIQVGVSYFEQIITVGWINLPT